MVMKMFEFNRTCEYKGVSYKVVSVLENDLLLVVNEKDYQQEKFPLQTCCSLITIANGQKHTSMVFSARIRTLSTRQLKSS